jgi:putative alpha-1,2-mannosidase
LHITANVIGGPGNEGNWFGQEKFYVQSVNINGKEWDKNWFMHEDLLVEGGTMEFVLGSEAKVWEGSDVPPSPGHVEL